MTDTMLDVACEAVTVPRCASAVDMAVTLNQILETHWWDDIVASLETEGRITVVYRADVTPHWYPEGCAEESVYCLVDRLTVVYRTRLDYVRSVDVTCPETSEANYIRRMAGIVRMRELLGTAHLALALVAHRPGSVRYQRAQQKVAELSRDLAEHFATPEHEIDYSWMDYPSDAYSWMDAYPG